MICSLITTRVILKKIKSKIPKKSYIVGVFMIKLALNIYKTNYDELGGLPGFSMGPKWFI